MYVYLAVFVFQTELSAMIGSEFMRGQQFLHTDWLFSIVYRFTWQIHSYGVCDALIQDPGCKDLYMLMLRQRTRFLTLLTTENNNENKICIIFCGVIIKLAYIYLFI